MDEIKIVNFENELVSLCNRTQIPNRTKYYILKDTAQKLLEASERDYAAEVNALKKERLEREKAERKEKEDATS